MAGTSVIWRNTQLRLHQLVCNGVDLNSGIILVSNGEKVVVMKDLKYFPRCYNNGLVLSSFRKSRSGNLPVVNDSWNYITSQDYGSFKYSVYPITYTVTVATVIVIFLTLIVFTNHTSNPSWALRFGSIIASINLVVVLVRAIAYLEDQYSYGYSSGEKLLNDLRSDNAFNIIDFVIVLISLFAQVQIIMRLFSRAREKRVTFVLGGALSICAQVIWGVSTFAVFDQLDDSDISILPPFTYLLRIALSTIYSCLVTVYAIGKRNFIFHKTIILLTILTLIVINAQIAFFIADVANVWVSELSEIFNTTIYIIATIVPWEWINRVHGLERQQQSEGILGRPVYEDENKDIIRYEIIDGPFNHEDQNNFNDVNDNDHDNHNYEYNDIKDISPNNFDNNDDDYNNNNINENDDYNDDKNDDKNNINNNNDNEDNQRVHEKPINNANGFNYPNNSNQFATAENPLSKRISNRFRSTKDTLLYYTDQLIEFSLSIPRSVSANSIKSDPNSHKPKNNSGALSNRRKEVFIYSQMDVKIVLEDQSGSNLSH